MQWIMNPFVNSSHPVIFNPTKKAGFCTKIIRDHFTFCLTYNYLSLDGATASMISTLKFVTVETINDVLLDRIIVQCNEKRKTLRVINSTGMCNYYSTCEGNYNHDPSPPVQDDNG